MTEQDTPRPFEIDEELDLSPQNAAQLEVAMLQAALSEAQSEYDQAHAERSPDALKIGRAIIQLTDWLVSLQRHEPIYEEIETEVRVPLSAEGTKLIEDIFGDVSELELDQSHIPEIIAALEELEQTALGTNRRMTLEAKQKLITFFTSDYGPGLHQQRPQVNRRVKGLRNTIFNNPEYTTDISLKILARRIFHEDDNEDVDRNSIEDYSLRLRNHVPYSELVKVILPITDHEDGGREPWRQAALCAETDPKLFFPEIGQSTISAKKICMSCAVRVECLEYALDNDEEYGIWGGKSRNQREEIARERLAAHLESQEESAL